MSSSGRSHGESTRFENLLRQGALILLAMYRTMLTTHLGGSCRYIPSCSEYAVDAVKNHPPLSALSLIIRRILRCRPGSSGGYDPVPACCEGAHHAKS